MFYKLNETIFLQATFFLRQSILCRSQHATENVIEVVMQFPVFYRVVKN